MLAKSARSRNAMLRISACVALAAMAGCSTHPDELHVDRVGVELVPSNRYIAARHAGEQALAVVFSGQAPFAAIVRDHRFPQFECELYSADGAQISEGDFGLMYFDGPLMKAAPTTGLVDMEDGESYRYRAVLSFGLKEKTSVNGPYDLDLLRSDYDHIACRLRGSQMYPTIWMSNDIVISKSEIVNLAGQEKPAN